MTDSDLLDALDRRARVAATAMDDAVASVEVPRFEPSADRDGARRGTSLAVAAAFVVVALTAAGIAILSGSDEPPPVANSFEPTHLVLADPEASGYELYAAFDGDSSTAEDVGLSYGQAATVQGSQDVDDPWDTAFVEYELPTESTTLGGDPVDIGGPEAMARADGFASTVGWVDGAVVRYLMSARLTTDELADIARAAVSAGTPAGAPIPGQEVLFSGSLQDVFPVLTTPIGSPAGIDGVSYRSPDEDGPGFVVGVAPGDEAAWRSSFVLARDEERTTIRGHDAVIAEFDQDLYEISWLEDDSTLVRVDFYEIDPTALVPVLDQLVSISAEEFDQLVADHPLPELGGSETFAGQGTEVLPGRELSSVAVEGADWSARAFVVVDDTGAVTLRSEVDWPTGGSGGEASLAGVDINNAVAEVHEGLGGRVVVFGLIGPSVTGVEVRDPRSGSAATGIGPSTATIDGSDHVVFLALLDPEWANRELVVVGTTATGEEIMVALSN